MQALRPAVAERALAARFRGKPLADKAERLLAIAQAGLGVRARLDKDGRDERVHLAALATLVEQGKCPAEELAENLPTEGRALSAEVVRRWRL
jgi:glutamate--cysteine ligase